VSNNGNDCNTALFQHPHIALGSGMV